MSFTQGLRFKKFDLHVHTPASADFKGEGDAERIVAAAVAKGLTGIAITDYQTGSSIDKIKAAANPYAMFIRGEAYLALHDGQNAREEFERILGRRAVVQNLPIGALAQLGLARANVISGNTQKARAAYEDFLTLWKDADTNIPILQRAKAEYGALK